MNNQSPQITKNEWFPIENPPKQEGYYEVKFENGDTDEKPFRIRPSKNIHGFMTMEKVTHWRQIP